ncbi:hypothetical protein FRC20_010173 [Serendipita sp. 405]|nr:hypothetical protein FRC20_010173 [Serendipita sp. 405]
MGGSRSCMGAQELADAQNVEQERPRLLGRSSRREQDPPQLRVSTQLFSMMKYDESAIEQVIERGQGLRSWQRSSHSLAPTTLEAMTSSFTLAHDNRGTLIETLIPTHSRSSQPGSAPTKVVIGL